MAATIPAMSDHTLKDCPAGSECQSFRHMIGGASRICGRFSGRRPFGRATTGRRFPPERGFVTRSAWPASPMLERTSASNGHRPAAAHRAALRPSEANPPFHASTLLTFLTLHPAVRFPLSRNNLARRLAALIRGPTRVWTKLAGGATSFSASLWLDLPQTALAGPVLIMWRRPIQA